MHPTIKNLLIILLSLNLFHACVKNEIDNPVTEQSEIENENEPEQPIEDLEMLNLVIPEGFEFETSEATTITINDNSSDAIYTVYAYNGTQYDLEEISISNEDGEADTVTVFNTDELNHILFTGRPIGGQLQHTAVIPSYYTQVYLIREEGNIFHSEILTIQNNTANYTHSDTTGKNRQAEVARFKAKYRSIKSRSRKSIEIDSLYCVNGSGQLFTVNPLTGNLTQRATMPMGSWTAAIDQANLYLYSVGRTSPYPLMRYDMINDSWTTVGNVGMGGPRLDYNDEDGLLYFSPDKARLYTIDPTNGRALSNWKINNLDVTVGGDLAFAEDGTLFLSSFGGLYRLDLDNNNEYLATRISGDNLPFTPTSMTFDSNNELWLASNGSNSNLIIMDTVTGGWEYVFGPNSDSGVTFGRAINDLTTFTFTDEEAIDPDTDGDGIPDSDDTYPDDAEKAFEQYTPSRYGWGTVAFEDLWPYQADYDFNDTAINYRFVAIQNAQNEVVQLDIHFEVTSDGAGLTNGFGIEFESIAPTQIESVVGTVITEDYISVASNGVEQGQNRAVIILFDNNETMVNVPTEVNVKFTVPLSTAQIGIAPFNSFLIVNKDRGREIHLPNRLRTNLGINTVNTEGVNQDPDGNYETNERLPWAINIIHDFKVPKERVPVNQAYNFFNEWATSGGTQYSDWYKDNPGYRNSSNIK